MRGTGRDGVIGSGCSGQEPLETLSGKEMARGSDSGAACGRGGVTSRVAGAPRTMFDSTTTSVGPPIMMQVLDIVAAHQDQTSARIDAGVIDHREPRLAAARAGAAEPAGTEAAHRPRGRADQTEHDQERQEEAYGERHFRAEQTLKHPPFSPRLRRPPIGPQWLTAPVTFAAPNTNK